MSNPNNIKRLIIGIGNASRGDDALGWAFIDRLSQFSESEVDLEYRYQLQVEDADFICDYDEVIFVDATTLDLRNGYEFIYCNPDADFTFSTHAISPGSIMALAKELYPNKMPKAFILQISGYQWDLDQGMSSNAKMNLEASLNEPKIKSFVEGSKKIVHTDKNIIHA